MITPIPINTNTIRNLGGFAVIELHFVPEPSVSTLLGACALAVAALGLRRR